MSELRIVSIEQENIDWRGWEYPSEASAVSQFDRLLRASRGATEDVERYDVGLWRSSTPDRKRHFVILAGRHGHVEELAKAVKQGKRHAVPEDVRVALWRRHVSQILDEYARTGDPKVDVRERHGSGVFLHSDGTMHPFPEPRGRG